MRAIRSSQLGSAALLTAAGYGVLTLYDALGLKFADAQLPYPRLALVSFMGYAIGHNVGVNTLSGGAIRFRAYSMLGLSPKQIATVVAFGTLTFALGSAALLGLSLLSEAALSGKVLNVLHVHRSIIVLAGCTLLVVVTAYLILACNRHEPLRWRKIVIPIPSPRIAFAQIGVASGDLLCAAGVLYSLLPAHAHIGFLAFAAMFIIAIAAGIISNVPGGVGVFESVLLLLFKAVPPDELLGALLAYRIIYYLIPFAVALALLGAHELWAHRGPMVRVAQLARTWLSTVTPQASALAVFGAGAALLFSGSTPGLVNRVWIGCVISCRCPCWSFPICSAARSGSASWCWRMVCTAGSMPRGI